MQDDAQGTVGLDLSEPTIRFGSSHEFRQPRSESLEWVCDTAQSFSCNTTKALAGREDEDCAFGPPEYQVERIPQSQFLGKWGEWNAACEEPSTRTVRAPLPAATASHTHTHITIAGALHKSALPHALVQPAHHGEWLASTPEPGNHAAQRRGAAIVVVVVVENAYLTAYVPSPPPRPFSFWAPTARQPSRFPFDPSPGATSNTCATVVLDSRQSPKPSCQVTPTDAREPSTTALDQPRYHHRELQPAGPPFTSALTSEDCQSLQDAAPSQRPINSQRQDSAISQQRIEASTDTQSSASSSEFLSSYSHRSPNHSQHHPASPRPNSQPTTPSSPPLLVAESCTSQLPSQSRAQSAARGHAKPPFQGNPVSMEPAKPHDHEAAFSSPTAIESATKTLGPSASSDQTNNSTTRQQRYNVRFIANYTSENMPPFQKPRPDPSPAVPAATENSEPEQSVTPSIEPSMQTAPPPNHQPTEDPSHAQRRRDPSVERCPGCHEAWKRPLPNTDSYRHSSPAENGNDLGRMSMNLIAKLQAHKKKADAMYEEWKWTHSHCPPQDYDTRPPSEAATEPQHDFHNPNRDGRLPDSKHAQAPSNKRKSDLAHDSGDQKVRKVTFEPQSTAAPPIRPSAST
ncbi:uncharacterized protein K460DRAFT_406221 [Cucurbitaria berberidis CBS 394.84]|uniref:Uncharacterized protein n=1 Tax=Cucurbitaria berberidis CBS 394.84 TaxID=1168544 RepID=A0A9P4GIS6_9PLEO|nr:uncharacterized protein K460DRAFT_406221 [Cucurbitaria berberidis CBS 394.84]KAF1845994.1 hypothetical protein K460DRAFT_406221 [Cucurbitaria berberidis CBS 394.84]